MKLIYVYPGRRCSACQAADRVGGGISIKNNLKTDGHQGTSTVSESLQALSTPPLKG